MNLRLWVLIIVYINFYKGTAQSILKGPNSTFAENAANNNLRSKLSVPFGAGSLPNMFSNVSVSSFFKEGVNGKIELQGKLGSRFSGGLTIDQKIGKSTKAAIPLALSGISPGTTVRLNIQKRFWQPSFNLSDNQIADLNKVTNAYEKRKGIPVNTAGLREISLDGTEEEKTLAFDVFNTVSFKEPWIINAEIGFTKTSFLYATDSFTLDENEDAFISPAFTVSLIKAFGKGFRVAGYAALSYMYSENYIAAEELTFTIPFGTSTNFYTSTLSFGLPRRQVIHNVTGEFRYNILARNNRTIAISPSGTFAVNSKKLSVFVPVYFISGSDDKGKLIDGLQGGVRFGYITSTQAGKVSSFSNGFIAQLIISQPLDILSKL